MNVRLRQDTILRTLLRNGSATVDALAQEVGASRRTVLRDISALRDEGYTIYAEVGRGGGLQLDPQSVQQASRLSVAEVFSLIVTVGAAKAAGAIPFSGLADAGLAKIEKSLPADRVKDLRRMLDCLHVGNLAPGFDLSDMREMDDALLPAFELAFLERRMLRFAYRDKNGRETVREVEPQAILILPPLWYLVSWDPMRDDFRYFRMDRLSAPEVLADKPFRKRYIPFKEDVTPYSSALPK